MFVTVCALIFKLIISYQTTAYSEALMASSTAATFHSDIPTNYIYNFFYQSYASLSFKSEFLKLKKLGGTILSKCAAVTLS